jgi:hypothetical protein
LGGVDFELMTIALIALSFCLGGILIAAFQSKRSAFPALVVGVLAGVLFAMVMLQVARIFAPNTSDNTLGFVLIGVLSFAVPFGTTMLGYWLVAKHRWQGSSRPLAEKDDARAGGDEGEAE